MPKKEEKNKEETKEKKPKAKKKEAPKEKKVKKKAPKKEKVEEPQKEEAEKKEEKVEEKEEKEKRTDRRGRREEEVSYETWKPKTLLGKKVLAGEITNINEVFEKGMKIAEPQIVDILLPDLEKDVIFIGGSTGKGGGKSGR